MNEFYILFAVIGFVLVGIVFVVTMTIRDSSKELTKGGYARLQQIINHPNFNLEEPQVKARLKQIKTAKKATRNDLWFIEEQYHLQETIAAKQNLIQDVTKKSPKYGTLGESLAKGQKSQNQAIIYYLKHRYEPNQNTNG